MTISSDSEPNSMIFPIRQPMRSHLHFLHSGSGPLYANAARECTHAIGLLGTGANPARSGAYAALKKALAIVLANAEDLDSSRVTADLGVQFDEQERRYIAITLAPDAVEDPGTLELDNALVLMYVAALIASPDDEEAMGEHRKFIVRLLAGYKKALGIK